MCFSLQKQSVLKQSDKWGQRFSQNKPPYLKKIQLPKANLDLICVNNKRKCKQAEIFLRTTLL